MTALPEQVTDAIIEVTSQENNTISTQVELKNVTNHLPFFDNFRRAAALEGQLYVPILKAAYHALVGMLIRNKNIRLGNVRHDPRTSVLLFIPSGRGKKNVMVVVSYVGKTLEFFVDRPLTLHSQQLIGKVVNRGRPTKPDWVKINGYLDRDVLIFDEAFELLTSDEQDIKESRRAVRISQDPFGENLIEKKQVDNKFTDEERISYSSAVTIFAFAQPKQYPPNIVEEGDLRRFIVAYQPGLTDSFCVDDFAARLGATVDLQEELKPFITWLRDCLKKVSGRAFTFTPEAAKLFSELHLSLLSTGFQRSKKESDFNKLMAFTLQDWLLKLSVHFAYLYGKVEVDEDCVRLGFLDLMEFYDMQLAFVKNKIMGGLDYGEGWRGAYGYDRQTLEWVYNAGAVSEDTSKLTIKDVKDYIAQLRKVSADMAEKHFARIRGQGLLGSKQLGQHDSRVWLAFKPVNVEFSIAEGIQGSKGRNAYSNVLGCLGDVLERLRGEK